jgi:hypothetical protein
LRVVRDGVPGRDPLPAQKPPAAVDSPARREEPFPPASLPERASFDLRRVSAPLGRDAGSETHLETSIPAASSRTDLPVRTEMGLPARFVAATVLPGASQPGAESLDDAAPQLESRGHDASFAASFVAPRPWVHALRGHEANFAVPLATPAEAELREVIPHDKSFVAPERESLTKRIRTLGTDVAKAAPSMPARFLPTPWQHPASEYALASSGGQGVLEAGSPGQPELESVEAVSTAHQAVEVVLRAVDDLSSREQKSVRLEFSVGDNELSVRIELHADEVRTTFRTDSAELRAALSHEWQAVAASGTADRSVRIAPALFNSAESSALNASAGDTASHHREPGSQSRHASEQHGSSAFVRSGDRSAPAPAVAASSPAAARVHTSRHLHTLA